MPFSHVLLPLTRHRWWLGPLTTTCLASLTGCSWLPEPIDETKGWPVEKLYSEAKDAMNDGNFAIALGYLDKIQARYPFGRYAQQAQLDTVYVQYKDSEPDAAIAAADRFIKTHPRHPRVDYAYYMRGLANFERSNTMLDRVLPRDRAKTDTASARQASNDFSELVRKFPQSPYAEDARARIFFLHNTLATAEVNTAAYYLQQGAYVAAVNRADSVLKTYARSPATEQALDIMTQAYFKMGMHQSAADTLRVLQHNYPTSTAIPALTALLKGAS